MKNNYDDIIGNLELKLHKKYGNDIYLNGEQLTLLRKLGINIEDYKNCNELLIALNMAIDSSNEDNIEELEDLAAEIQNFLYYNKYNK